MNRLDPWPVRCLLVLGAFLAAHLAGASATAETLEESLAQAYAGHPRILAARADIGVAAARIREAESMARVNLAGSAGINGTYRTTTSEARGDDSHTHENHTHGNGASENQGVVLTPEETGSSTSDDTTLGVQAQVRVSRRLYDFGVVSGSVNAARSDFEAAGSRLREAEQEVLYAAAIAYLGLLRAEAGVQLAKRGEEVIESDLEATRDKYQVGEVTQTDIAQAEARLADRRAERVTSESRLEIARAMYREAMGSDPISVLHFPATLPKIPENLERATRIMLDVHPRLQALRGVVDSAQYALRSTRGRIFPTIDAVGSAIHAENPNTFFERSSELSVGIEIEIPLYAGGRARAAVTRFEETLSQRRHDLDVALREMTRRTTNAWEMFASAQDGVSAFEASVRANQIASEGVRREAEVGSRTTLDVLDAELELLRASDNLDQARHDVYVAAYNLRRAVGTMTASDWNLSAEN